MKKKYKILSLLKRIKKSNLSSNLNTLNSEKKKLERINVELKDLLNNSDFKAGEILNSSQLKNTSSFRNNIQEKIQISQNREGHIDKEISNYIGQITKVRRQEEKIKDKIREDSFIEEKLNELKNDENFKVKRIM